MKTVRCNSDSTTVCIIFVVALCMSLTTMYITWKQGDTLNMGMQGIDPANHVRLVSERGVDKSALSSSKTISVEHHRGESDVSTARVRLAADTLETSIQTAILNALDLPNSFEFFLTNANEEVIPVSPGLLVDGMVYRLNQKRQSDGKPLYVPALSLAKVSADRDTLMHQLSKLNAQLALSKRIEDHAADSSMTIKDGSVQEGTAMKPCSEQVQIPQDTNGLRLSGKPARLPRVVLTSLGTGRYRHIAIAALESAKEHFGGDCEVSLHLLSDDIDGVDPVFNPAFAPYREWPESGLSKFEDILSALREPIQKADYFFFFDGDVRFNEDVLLADVAADLTGVEHPFYPRNHMGFCKPAAPPAQRGFCGYPYDRNPKSQIQIPEGCGRYFHKIVDPKRGDYWAIRSNAWYLQSAFWGGKSSKIIPLLEDLKTRVDIDRSHNVYSMVVQDERYINYYFWKHGNDSDTNIRILKSSYLYPYQPRGFGDWVSNFTRPIIIHGTAKGGKMIKGEAEFKIVDTQQCLDAGAVTLKDSVGVYGCHSVAYRGGSQGFIWTDSRIRIAYGKSDKPGDKTCIDGTGVTPGKPLLGKKCMPLSVPGSRGQQWVHDNDTHWIRNKLTGLCIDPMRLDKTMYPDAAKDPKFPVSVNQCGKSKFQKFEITFISLEETKKARDAANMMRAQGH